MTGRKKTRKIMKPAAKLARTKKELAEERGERKKSVRVGLAVKVAKTIPSAKLRTGTERKRMAKKIITEAIEKRNVEGTQRDKAEGTDRERIDREKRLIMWSGVTFFMILVGFFWLYNTKAVFERTKTENKGQEESIDWDELVENIGENIEKMKEGLESVKKASEEAQAGLPAGEEELSSSSSEAAGVATTTPEVASNEKIEALKRKLENNTD